MQPYTEELVKKIEDVPDDVKDQFVKVPQKLQSDASNVLGRLDRVKVKPDTESGKKLLSWAAVERKKVDAKKRRRRAKKSRKKNRK